MPEKNKPEFDSDPDFSHISTSSPQHEVSVPNDAPPLNFQSPEYNTIDDLDDNREDYRSFRPLDGIVTADMRFHEERKKKKGSSHPSDRKTARPADGQAKEKKDEKRQPLSPLTLFSKGRTLVIAHDLDSALQCSKLLTGRGLKCVICILASDTGEPLLSAVDSFSLIEAGVISITGSFCGFTVKAVGNDAQVNLSSLLQNEFDFFDLVLDLKQNPSYSGRQLPVGYYSVPGNDQDLLGQALAELSEMKGQFTKPQFISLDEKKCIHGRSGAVECNRCVQLCPVSAIRSSGRKIVIDHYLCQGCASCELVCPADAIRMTSLDYFLPEIITKLKNSAVDSACCPHLVLWDGNIDDDNYPGERDGTVFYSVEEIAAVGLHVQLVALAFGAGSVSIVCDDSRPQDVRQELKNQVELAGRILLETGLQPDSIRMIVYSSWKAGESQSEAKISLSELPPHFNKAAFSLEHDKRTLTRLAVQHLYVQSGKTQTFLPLPAGAPFGAVAVNPETCSLCMSCVGACPSGALAASGNIPRISTFESRCHQCGLCAAICPENAIKLEPRMLIDFESANSPKVMHEVEPFRCIECGEPFATQAMISRMQEKLTSHWMYGSEQQKRRLKMCRTCRTRDALMSGDYRR